MRFLLDTHVLSEVRRRTADPSVVAWMSAQTTSDLAISVVTVMELEIGIGRVARRDQRQAAVLKAWLEKKVLTGFAGRILPVDLDVARTAATLHVPDPRPERDTLLAATAMAFGLTVVSRNVTDFAHAGLAVVDPWAG